LNFLAHFHLARNTDASRVGALLGDFVRGTPESLRAQFPDEVIEGIMLHRAVDQFTDSHPVFLESKQLLSPERRRFAGIIIDVFFDHFLARHWKDYSDEPLDHFISEIHRILDRRTEWLTPELEALLPRMQSENWLGSYATLEGLALTFRRVSTRRSFLTPLIGAEEDLIANFHSFDKTFRVFYPELMNFARSK